MVGYNGHCLGKVRIGMSAEGRMHYNYRDNENNSNKNTEDALGSTNTRNSGGVFITDGSICLPRADPRNLGIGHNRIWAKAYKVNSKFSTIKNRVTPRHTFSKYRIVIPTREEWGENWPNQLRKEHVWFTDRACYLWGTGAGICKY